MFSSLPVIQARSVRVFCSFSPQQLKYCSQHKLSAQRKSDAGEDVLPAAMSSFEVGLMERLLNAGGDNHTDPGSGHVNSSENDVFLQSGTEPQHASSLIILHLGHTPHVQNRL